MATTHISNSSFMYQLHKVLILNVVLILWSSLVFAQDDQKSAASASVNETPDAKSALTLADVESTLAGIEADAATPASVKAEYKQAVDALKQARDYSTSMSQYSDAIENGSAQAQKLRDQLQKLPSLQSAANVTAPTEDTKELQRDIDARRAALSALNDEQSKTTAELARVKGRPAEISARLPKAQTELSDLAKQLTTASPATESSSEAADRILLQASHAKLVAELEMLKQEQASQSIREDLLTEKQNLLKRQIANAKASIDALQAVLDQRLAGEAERIAEALPQDVPEDDAEAQALATEVQDLAKEFELVVNDLKKAGPERREVKSQLQGLTEQYDLVRGVLDSGSGGQSMAQALLDLDDLARSSTPLSTLSTTLEQSRLASFEVNEKLRKQSDVEQQFAGRSSQSIARLVTAREEVLDKLKTQYDSLRLALSELEGDRKSLSEKSKEVRTYAMTELLGFGIKSCPPVGTITFSELAAAVSWTFSSEHWLKLGVRLQSAANRWPVLTIVVVIVITTLLIMRRFFVAVLVSTGNEIRRISTDRYTLTLEALGLTVLLALPIPMLLGFAAWGLSLAVEPGDDWVRGLADGLWPATSIAFASAFLAAVCRPNGLGAAHFGWTRIPLGRLRRAILQFAVCYVPALLCTHSLMHGDASDFLGSLGRVSFILAQVWTLIVLWRLLQGSEGLLAMLAREYPKHLVTRWRYLWVTLLLAIPVSLVTIACLGYLIPAASISLGILITTVIIALGEILYCMMLRWFRIKQRRLALEEALERRRLRQAAAEIEVECEQASEVVAVDAEADLQLDMELISEQTRSLLRLLYGLGVLTAIIVFWSGVIPLDDMLQQVPIPLIGMNALGLLQAILAVAITYFAVQNLPGLLELAVLRAKPMDPGARNAITTLCQYALIAIGAAALFNILQLDWEKFGWMAAALSVGIGFGLQEVVANFVCGLILLLEQPIRVGDVVTLDGTTGTVTKIHLRATTVTNWDRQDLVVPNKNLITGTILNWTLNASVNRLVLPVGVAYGADTEKARQILLEVAADHPVILAEPAPIASVESFGDSSVNLMLRVYLPDLDKRISVRTELHNDIIKRFDAAGIEIPFPQQDLHIRDGLDGISPAVSGQTGDEHAESFGIPPR